MNRRTTDGASINSVAPHCITSGVSLYFLLMDQIKNNKKEVQSMSFILKIGWCVVSPQWCMGGAGEGKYYYFYFVLIFNANQLNYFNFIGCTPPCDVCEDLLTKK